MRTIEEIFAFIVTDHAGGGEGVLRRREEFGTQPMIADSIERLQQFRPEAETGAAEMGMPLSVAKFVRAREIK